MRIWSLNPKYLDQKGLTGLWREALLAQNVLCGKTRGYRNHPQLIRFRSQRSPRSAIAFYLSKVWEEAKRRGYNFDKCKVGKFADVDKISVTRGQVEFEFGLLLKKINKREPDKLRSLSGVKKIEPHPIFRIVAGPVESWEHSTL